ncbi:hypothetical protein WDU94_006984 [Cyamophila willieti]
MSDEENKAKNKNSHQPLDLWNYVPNRREEAVLAQCSRVAWLRFIPTAIVSGMATLYGVEQGYLKPNRTLGALPKLIASTVVSYVISQLSVKRECREAIKTLRHSPLAEHIREMERKK